jgi:cyclophilin family peptidyl-prolyl cis-trans isomerase
MLPRLHRDRLDVPTQCPARIGSQFFVSRGDSSSVARNYDIFGQVTAGFPALSALQKGTTITWIAIAITAPEP